MSKHLAILLLTTLAGCTADRAPERTLNSLAGREVCDNPIDRPKPVSIATLLARPEMYEGRAVRVIGFYRADFEHSAIYLHREDAVQSILANGLWVLGDIPPALRDRYVAIEGIFTTSVRGHLSQWPATICGVTTATPWGRDEP